MLGKKSLKLSLHQRLQLYFASFVILPIFLVAIILYFVVLDSAEQNAIKFSNQIISRISTEIEDMFSDSYSVKSLITEDVFIQDILRKPLDENLAERFSSDLALDSRLNYIASFNENLFGIYLIAENGGVYKSNYTTAREEDLRLTDWYQKIIQSDEAIWFGTHIESFATETSGNSLVSIGFPIKDKATGNNVGSLIVDIEESRLSDMINREIGSEGYIFIIDEALNIVSHPDRTLINSQAELKIPNDYNLSEYGTGHYIEEAEEDSIIIFKSFPINRWKLVASLPTSGLTEDIDNIRDIILLSLLFITLFSLVAAYSISDSIVKPIRKMMRLMKKVEGGDLEVNMPVESSDEIGDLSHSFNQMIKKVKDLMNDVLGEQKELRKAELKALQSQINPHFLYNTLATIIWMARENENDKIIKIVTAITKYYRIGISRGRDSISIEEEIEHISNYLIILYQRYSDKFEYDIDIPLHLHKYMTLKLILQPIVENAIYHGVKTIREKGYIEISAVEVEDDIIFTIRDTGIGMTPEKLISLREAINDFEGEHLESYGLRNVNERLKIFFGVSYGLTINSEEGIGTTVEVRIPKIVEA